MSQGVTPQSATLANVNSSATSVTLFAAATGHVNMRVIYNDSTQVLYVAFQSTAASATSYTVQIASQGYFEFPYPAYSGQVNGIWASANGAARLTSW